MTNYAPPSRNTADDDTLAGVLQLVMGKFLQNTDNMLPAKVLAYSRATNRAQVQPLIVTVTTTNVQVQKGQIASVPVQQDGGGGFVRSDPLNTGDLGWIKACDRDISIFKQTYQQSAPNTQRKHNFSDAVFIPDTMLNGVAIASEDANNSVWQNYTGSVKIALWSNLIKILAPMGVGIGGTPNQHAILDLQSTTQAFIYPRMTTVQKLSIPTPIEGMAVWDLNEHGVSTYNGSAWS